MYLSKILKDFYVTLVDNVVDYKLWFLLALVMCYIYYFPLQHYHGLQHNKLYDFSHLNKNIIHIVKFQIHIVTMVTQPKYSLCWHGNHKTTPTSVTFSITFSILPSLPGISNGVICYLLWIRDRIFITNIHMSTQRQ